jgi:polyhydroxybutyrate depolymerase
MRLAALILMLACALSSARADGPCGADAPCKVDGGFYHAYVPAGWDGRPALKAVMFFHGWREEAKNLLADTAMHEFAFINAVLDDALRRLPLDAAQVYAAGFSQGGSMVWNLACHAPARFAGFLPVAGGFWEPIPQGCVAGPRRVLHVHGLDDATVPMTGRTLRNGLFRQGDIRKGWELLRQGASCGPEAGSFRRGGRFACEHVKGCMPPAALELCLFEGGHMMEPAFLDLGMDWMEAEGG